jgi:hypothetical protein
VLVEAPDGGGMTVLEAARAWDEAFAEWIRLDDLGPMYHGARDAQALRMTDAMNVIFQAVTA